MFNVGHIHVSYLAEGLKAIGVPNPQLVLEKYKDAVDDEFVNKITFLYVMEEEH